MAKSNWPRLKILQISGNLVGNSALKYINLSNWRMMKSIYLKES